MSIQHHSPPPGPQVGEHPLLAAARALEETCAEATHAAAWSMTPGEQRETLRVLARAEARVAEMGLRVLAAADRNQVGAESGATSTGAWLAHETRTARPAAHRRVRLARALEDGFAATGRALAGGAIDTERAGVVVDAVGRLTDEYDDLPEGTHAAAEAHLLELAAEFDAATLRRLGKRLFEVVCPEATDRVEGEQLAREEERARARAAVRMRDNGDGTVEGSFRLPTLHGEILRKALEGLTSPRRLGQDRVNPTTGTRHPHPHLWGLGLMELLENHIAIETMPGENHSPFTLVVTLDLDALLTGLSSVATLDTGARISAGEARRLACRAGIIPMVLGGSSEPLDLGRERRLFTKAQRIAMAHRHGGCAAANCDRPPAWTEAHHKHPWRHGGHTNLTDGLPLCPPHHHMADHPEHWDMRTLPTGAVRFARRT